MKSEINDTNERNKYFKVGFWARALLDQRFRLGALFLSLFMATSLLTRVALVVRSADKISWNWTLFAAFVIGSVFDLIAGRLVAIPIFLYLALVPQKIWLMRFHRIMMYIAGLATIYGLGFIAVDYLVYTKEVVGNIRESYETGTIFGLLAVAAVIVWLLILRFTPATAWSGRANPLKTRLLAAVLFIVAPATAVTFVSQSDIPEFANNFNREAAKDGIFSFVSAFRSNHLNYDQFYLTQDRKKVFARLNNMLATPDSQSIPGISESVARRITGRPGPERHYNVIQITVESVSASFMAHFGNTLGLTPNLDRLASEGLVFTNFYATGTRTTRGMEALALSLPPTPGRSIVHRENNKNLFSLGSVLRSRGYDTLFLYGGYGYFDQMNAFFGNNGYRVLDRSAMPKDEVTFATIWGACDEDLLRWTLAAADSDFAKGVPFHFFAMTTSNHRPFTYPDGRIDIPSKTGRNGAVKYTDFAIGQFIEQARTRPWFADTIFVIVADHCAASAGKTDLTVPNYQIPMIFYNPGLIEPGVASALSSQVDFSPTLLALMGWSYNSLFFGHDILAAQPEMERALIGNYQTLGMLTKDHLQVLRPNFEGHSYLADRSTGELTLVATDPGLVADAVALYQGAGILFDEGRYSEKVVVN